MAGDLKKDERGDDAALMHMATEFKDWMLEQERIKANAQVDIAKAQMPVLLKEREVAHERERTIARIATGAAIFLCLCVVGAFILIAIRGTSLGSVAAFMSKCMMYLGAGATALVGKDLISHFRKPPT